MSFEELAARCRNRWPDIVRALSKQDAMSDAIDRGPRRHGYCPIHEGKNGDAFRIYADFAESGGAVCNSCGARANGFQLLKWLNGWSWAETAVAVEEYLDDGTRAQTSAAVSTVPAKPEVDNAPPFSTLRRMWQEGYLLTAPEADVLRLYFERRGLTDIKPVPVMLRLHPHMLYVDYVTKQRQGRYPTLMAPIIGPVGKMVGLYRAFLSADGKLASVSVPKKPLRAQGATLSGGAVRLSAAGPILGVTEGVETGIAVMIGSGMPVWAATSTSLMGSLVVPQSVRHVVIWEDNDVEKKGKRAGRIAAERLAARMEAEGRTFEIQSPTLPDKEQGVDWNDVLVAQGPAGFPAVCRELPPLPTYFSLSSAAQRRSEGTVTSVIGRG